MKKITRKHGVALLAIALANFNLSAQDGGATSELNPLNVIGSKSDAPALSRGMKSSLDAMDSPKSISIMTDDQIQAQGLKSIGDIIDYTPGVINSQGEGHRDAIVIRGKRTTQDFFRDGVRDDVQYYRPLYNIEQVEILRGSDALTSGYGGAHGMVNRVTKKGVIGESFSVVKGSVDTFGETVFSLDNNYQLGEDKALRVNMFGDNLENHRDYYYGNSFGVNPTMKMNLGDGSTLDISYEYLNQERFIDRGIPTGDDDTLSTYLTPIESLKEYVFADPKENFSTHEAHIFKAVYEHNINDTLTGRLSASYSDHDKLYQCLYANKYNQTTQIVNLTGYVDTTQRSSSIFSYEVTGEFETGSIVHNITAGAEYLSMDNDNDRYYADWFTKRNPGQTVGAAFSALDLNPLYTLPGSSSAAKNAAKAHDDENFALARLMVSNNAGINADGNQTFNDYTMAYFDNYAGDMSVFSFYLQDEMELTDSLDLILSARIDNMDYDVQYNLPNQTSADDRADSDETISPKVGLIYDLTDQASLYAVYSETFQQMAGDQYANIKQAWSKDVDPIVHETTEFGVKYDLPIGMSLSAAYFEIESNTPNQISSGVYGMSQSEVSGFELQLVGTISDNWYVSAGYTSLEAEDSSGRRIQEAPENVFSIFNNYLVTDRLAFNLGIIYQDSSIIDNDDYGTNSGTTGRSYGSNPPYLPDYTRVDVGAAYALTDNTRLQIQVENLTDELYFPSAHDTHQATVGAPVNATFSITSSF
jgi:catecholate siderophore receptor